MYGPIESSATYASALSTLQHQLDEVRLCSMLVPLEPDAAIWLGLAKNAYCAELADLRQEVDELFLMLSFVAGQFEVLAGAQ
jgi:hypothetical protein